jgi:class 3 adenylate cyclase
VTATDGRETSTFVFADLAGWTALTAAHGDADALRIVTDFEARVRSVLPRHHAQEIKTIGDAVMIRVDDPAEAVALELDLSRGLSAPGSPPVCIGMSTGPALERDGDWFGATVNLASRVAGAARPGEVLLTEATRAALPERGTFHLEPRGARRLRHIPDPVSVYRAIDAETGTPTLEIDPVCRMAVDPARAAAVRRRLGMTRYFCSTACATAFDARPRRYIAASPAARTARNGFLINLAAFVVVGMAHVLGWLTRGEAHNLLPAALVGVAWAAVLVIHFRMVRRVL